MLEMSGPNDVLGLAREHWKSTIAIVAFLGSLVPLGQKFYSFVWTTLDRRRLIKRAGGDLYTRADLLRALTNYVKPNCQSIDPSGGEDFRNTVAVRQDAHKQLEELLDPTRDERHCLLLADSGMGKTTLLLNFFARHSRQSHPSYQLLLIPLGAKGADALIAKAKGKSNTVLLMDAFDEDIKAIADHKQRLSDLLQLSEEFAKVLLTCRTQFFERDDEIPSDTGMARFGVKGAGQPGTYRMRKVYLSPFDENQIEEFLNRQFPIWSFQQRKRAKEIAMRMGDLTARPMLLAHIKDLIEGQRTYASNADIYAAMIDAWLLRESNFVEPASLREVSEVLARNIYSQREARGSERMPLEEAMAIARRLKIKLTGRQLGARSLLNRDAAGNVKFAHRSILEFLFICDYLKGSVRDVRSRKRLEWTDQMKRFWWDLVGAEWRGHALEGIGAHGADLVYIARATGDLSGLFELDLKSMVTLRSVPRSEAPGRLDSELKQFAAYNLSHCCYTRTFPCVMEAGETGQNNIPTVADFGARLMWQSECHPMTKGQRPQDIPDELNRIGLGGYKDWRMPTTVEVTSLLPNDVKAYQNYPATYPFGLFKMQADGYWTSDTSLQSKPIVFLIRGGGPYACGPREEDEVAKLEEYGVSPPQFLVRCVRSF